MKMLKHFYFKIIKEDIAKRYMQSRAMHVMAAIFLFFYGMYYLLQGDESWMMILAIVPPSLLIIILVIFKRRLFEDANNNKVFRILECGFLVMATLFYWDEHKIIISIIYGLVSAVTLILFWMENRLFHDQYIGILDNMIEVELPFFTKKYTWKEVEQVTIKNHYLSLQLKGNKFLQLRIEDDLDEEQRTHFFEYCQQRIAK